MTNVTLRRSIRDALAACGSRPLAERVRTLLGYRSDRYVDAGPSAAEFLDTFDGGGRLSRDNARHGYKVADPRHMRSGMVDVCNRLFEAFQWPEFKP